MCGKQQIIVSNNTVIKNIFVIILKTYRINSIGF